MLFKLFLKAWTALEILMQKSQSIWRKDTQFDWSVKSPNYYLSKLRQKIILNKTVWPKEAYRLRRNISSSTYLSRRGDGRVHGYGDGTEQVQGKYGAGG